MTAKEFQRLCNNALTFVKEKAPNPKTRGIGYYKNPYGNWQKCSTGNLAFNSIKIEFINKDEAMIYVDEDIAPYMPYTNEEWISPQWLGHKNPNESWWQNTIEKLAKNIASEYDGRISK